eukprot:scaffold210441_cov19-Tisochrysis_lutea.AAC.3
MQNMHRNGPAVSAGPAAAGLPKPPTALTWECCGGSRGKGYIYPWNYYHHTNDGGHRPTTALTMRA